MDFSSFQSARLIPVTGIKGDLDQERRATSAFLAVLSAVPDFAKSVLKTAGAPAGKIETFIEPEFEVGEKRIRPDGLISIERGGRRWVALVEVKTGKNILAADQLNSYLEIIRLNKFDALITISNEVLTLSGTHPTSGLDARKMRNVALTHLSWIRLITLAIVQSEFTTVKDPDQAWILRELIRFLQHDASGANEFDDMGPNWVGVRDGVVAGTVISSDKRLSEVIQSFESLLRFAAFKLSARLGVIATEVTPKIAKDDPKKHITAEIAGFIASKSLSGAIKVPGACSDLTVVADLRASQVIYSLTLSAPREGKNSTRLNWLLKQLKEAPEQLRIEIFTKHSRQPDSSTLLSVARPDPSKILPDASKEIVSFTLSLALKMGSKRGNGSGSFIGNLVDGIETFYGTVMQPLKPWQSKAPKLSETITELIPAEMKQSASQGQE